MSYQLFSCFPISLELLSGSALDQPICMRTGANKLWQHVFTSLVVHTTLASEGKVSKPLHEVFYGLVFTLFREKKSAHVHVHLVFEETN